MDIAKAIQTEFTTKFQIVQDFIRSTKDAGFHKTHKIWLPKSLIDKNFADLDCL